MATPRRLLAQGIYSSKTLPPVRVRILHRVYGEDSAPSIHDPRQSRTKHVLVAGKSIYCWKADRDMETQPSINPFTRLYEYQYRLQSPRLRCPHQLTAMNKTQVPGTRQLQQWWQHHKLGKEHQTKQCKRQYNVSHHHLNQRECVLYTDYMSHQ